MEEERSAEAPLLPTQADDAGEEEVDLYFQPSSDYYELNGQTRLTQATAALATTIIGSGIMALPKAFATLGLLVGAAMLALVHALSSFSLQELVHVSHVTRKWTYMELAQQQFGRAGVIALQVAIILNNAGALTVYLIIIGDVLVGVPPSYSGLLTNLLGLHDPSLWYISRPFVMAVVCALFLAPLLSLRDLSTLGPMSTASVAIAATFAASIVGLAGLAIGRGMEGDFHWLPTREMLGESTSEVAINLLAVLPVMSMSLVCHYNVHPIAHSLERFTQRRMRMVVRRALLVCTAVFTLVAAGGYVVFGSHTDANILNNLTPESVAPLLGARPASALCFLVRAGYCLSLMGTFAMINWALRETISNLVYQVPTPPDNAFLPLSWSVLAAIYVVSILVPNVWFAMSLTGATAAVFVAFILPGALSLKLNDSVWRSAAAWFCIVIGFAMGTAAILNTLVFKH